MTYESYPADREHYAASLTLEPQSGRLTWTVLPGQDSILVRTPYGVDPADEAETLLELLNRHCPLLPVERFHALSKRVSVRYVSAEEKARAQGCRADGEACTYTVFPCAADGSKGVCAIYIASGRDSMSSPRCDAPMNIRVEVTPVKPRTGLFPFLREASPGLSLFRRDAAPEPSPSRRDAAPGLSLFRRDTAPAFFRIAFPDACPENYRDGDLEYAVNDRWHIPITRGMMERGEFYVRTERKPVLTARNAGIRLTEPRRNA